MSWWTRSKQSLLWLFSCRSRRNKEKYGN